LAPTRLNGPPKLALTGPAVASGGEADCSRGIRNRAAVPTIASATSAHSISRTRFKLDFGGAFSVTSDHHAQVGAASGRVERTYRPCAHQRNLPREGQADAATPSRLHLPLK
jgi:hypothetical protein